MKRKRDWSDASASRERPKTARRPPEAAGEAPSRASEGTPSTDTSTVALRPPELRDKFLLFGRRGLWYLAAATPGP